MGVKCHKQELDGSHSNSSHAMKFFKIVVNPQERRLRIPKEFGRRCTRYLPKKVTLKTPGGPLTEVGLCRSNGDIWMDKGWQQFKDYNSIGFGDMVVFEYDMNSHFRVLIFDTTALEIEYPLDNTNLNKMSETKVILESESDDDSVVFLGKFSRSLKGEGEKKNPERINPSVGQEIKKTWQNFSSHVEGSSKLVKTSKMKLGKGKEISDERVGTIYDKNKCKAFQIAKACKFYNPYYIALMQPSYVSHPYILCIGLSFAKKYLHNKRNNLKLQVSNRKMWSVRCTLGSCNAKVIGGWEKFVHDNDLKVGDACVFEVVKKSKLNVWNVAIFRG